MLDTNVVKEMILYYNYIKRNGKENTNNLIMKNTLKLNNKRRMLELKIGKDYFLKNNKGSFIDNINLYLKDSEHKLNAAVAKIDNKIKNLTLKLECKLYTKGKRIIEPINLEANKEKINTEINKLKKEKELLIKSYNVLKKQIESYKDLKNSIDCGLIFKRSLEGEVKLHVNQFVIGELRVHTVKNEDPNWFYINKRTFVDFSRRHLTSVTADSEKTISDIEALAKDYRTPNSLANDKEMSEDKNFVDEYGD